MKKILISGSNGLLGQNLLDQLIPRHDCQILAISKSPDLYPCQSGYSFKQIDLSQRQNVLDIPEYFCPDIVIHGAAMTQVDPCELNPDLCTKVNVEGTRNMADLSASCGAKFIYISTDFVFDGEGGPYKEDDILNPVSHYGWSKLEGEKITQSINVPWAIVRTILVYGLTPAMSRSNLVLWVKESLEKKQAIRVVEDQFRMPTLVNDLVWGVIRIMDLEKQGIYHLSGSDYRSILELAIEIAQFFDLDTSLISPIHSSELNQPGKRPPNTGFILDKARTELGYQPKNFNQGLTVVQNLLEEMK
ncbi:MAG: SDR family oxidoreductase [Bacteroidales bacterium]|nr:SDR family oxidoreductase [Bacteroidales bacterium]